MSSRVMPGGKQPIVSVVLPMHGLLIAALTNCSEKFLLAYEME